MAQAAKGLTLESMLGGLVITGNYYYVCQARIPHTLSALQYTTVLPYLAQLAPCRVAL